MGLLLCEPAFVILLLFLLTFVHVFLALLYLILIVNYILCKFRLETIFFFSVQSAFLYEGRNMFSLGIL